MKKLIAILLSLTFVLSVSVLAATSTTPSEQSSSKEVTATYSTSTGAPTYSVDIAWGSMEFVYSTTGKWNPATHNYTTGSSGNWVWDDGTNVVTITNHSDAAINCDISFESLLEGEVSGAITPATIVLPSAVDKDLSATELTKSSTLTLNGSLDSTYNEATVIGSVSVIISAY